MIEDVAKVLKKAIASTHRNFFDSKLAHKYSFKVSVLRVSLINELKDRIREYKKTLKDIPETPMGGPGISAEDQRVKLDKEFDDAGGIEKILKAAAEEGIRNNFIDEAKVRNAFNQGGALSQPDLFGNKTKRQKFEVKKLNNNGLNVIFEKGQVGKAAGRTAKSQKGAYQKILTRATKTLYREARSEAFNYIELNVTAHAKSKTGKGSGVGMRSAGGKDIEKKLIKGHGRAKGLGMEVKSQGGEQTTVAVMSLAKDFAKIQKTRKFKMSAKYDQDIIDSVVNVRNEILSQVALEYDLERFVDMDTKHFEEDLVVDVHATDHKGNKALRHYDANGIREYIDTHIKKHLIPTMTKNLSKKKAIQMKGSRSKQELLELAHKTILVENLLKVKGTRPDFRLKVNKKLLADAKKVKGKKKSKAKPFTVANKPGKGSTVTYGGAKSAKGYQKSKAKGEAAARTSQSPIALRNLLNEVLPAQVAQNMGSPALNYRTGRFANSARVEMVHQGPRGGIAIDYTYMRNPYETFEPGGKQGSTQRDPRKVIGQSIRELAIGIIGKLPHTIRRT